VTQINIFVQIVLLCNSLGVVVYIVPVRVEAFPVWIRRPRKLCNSLSVLGLPSSRTGAGVRVNTVVKKLLKTRREAPCNYRFLLMGGRNGKPTW
jgi:alanine-alpha-ketoisovalerate/valine-pyruvate aminotransferase